MLKFRSRANFGWKYSYRINPCLSYLKGFSYPVVISSGLRCTAFPKSFAWALDGFDLYCSRTKQVRKISEAEPGSNPWPPGEKHECYLCAVQPPIIFKSFQLFGSLDASAFFWPTGFDSDLIATFDFNRVTPPVKKSENSPIVEWEP